MTFYVKEVGDMSNNQYLKNSEKEIIAVGTIISGSI